MRIYLAGAINGCSDLEARGWRTGAHRLLTRHEILDPMRRDYRGREDGNAAEIVESDLREIASCDALLVNAMRPSWGTAMEIREAWRTGKRVVGFAHGPVSPWLRYHAEIAPDLRSACVALTGGAA